MPPSPDLDLERNWTKMPQVPLLKPGPRAKTGENAAGGVSKLE